MGIALVTSFAAREVFVGTMATLYSIQSAADDEASLKEKMKNEVNLNTGKPVFTLPVGLSLMIFYAFAMQCMSTLAVTYRETKGWKWPILQTVYMTALAYVSALAVYTFFS
jgi:ferrous iron transport protein B